MEEKYVMESNMIQRCRNKDYVQQVFQQSVDHVDHLETLEDHVSNITHYICFIT